MTIILRSKYLPSILGFGGMEANMVHLIGFLYIGVFLMFNRLPTVLSQESCQFSAGQKDFAKDIDENAPVGTEAFKLQVFPRDRFSLDSDDGQPTDVVYFKHEEVGDKDIVVKVAKSLEDLVDQANPKTILKFKFACVGSNGTEIVHVPVEVRINDVNDHVPEFKGAPYALEIDELTPVGTTVFRNIKAVDEDQPKSDNSKLKYSITSGNVRDTFTMPDPSQGNLVLARPLDYDEGIREYNLEIQAQDHGKPSLSTLATLIIKIRDTDDQNPTFSQDLYQVRIREKSIVTGLPIREKLHIVPKIEAYDKDRAINSSIRYSILSGNEKKLFDIDLENGHLYLVQEIDREALDDTSFSLQIQATQSDNSLRQGLARVDIQVQDINDNLPIFDTKLYNISILENAPNGFRVTQVHAHDADTGDNANFKYRLEDRSDAFTINPTNGWILVKDHNKLDREVNNKLKFKVFADEEVPNVQLDAKVSFTVVEVKLLDTNDNNPSFIPSGLYEFNVSELAEPGDIIGNILAEDPDLGDNGQVFYYLPNDTMSDAAHFGIMPQNGSIFVLQSYSNEHNKPLFYSMFVAAADRPDNPKERRYSLALVKINVIDVNNNAPEILGLPYEASVGENLPPGTLVLQCKAKDADVNTKLEYTLLPLNGSSNFQINKFTGMITTSATLDYEETNEYVLAIEVSDGDHVSTASAAIYVIDVNDHVPQFEQSVYKFQVMEEQQSEAMLGRVKATDGDQGENGKLSYTFLGVGHNTTFSINDDGNIGILRRFDRERRPKFELIVAAVDNGVPSLSSTAKVEITVVDINDNQPKFRNERILVEIPEELVPPVFLLKVEAFDPDEGENALVHYEITSGNEDREFAINETTGEIHTRKALDYELKSVYTLNVTARNVKPFEGNVKTKHDSPSIMQLLINIEDRHDSVPKFQKKSYLFSVSENSPKEVIIGSVNATDSNAKFEQKMTYWMPHSNDRKSIVSINPTTGDVILHKSMDYDPPKKERHINLTVYARDELSISKANASANITIQIEDVNDNKPVFAKDTYQVVVPEDKQLNSTLPVQLKVTDSDDGLNGKISSYAILTTQDYFSIDNATGEISLVQSLDYELEQRYILQVAAIDSGIPPQTGSVVVLVTVENINEFPPVFANVSSEFTANENFPIGGQIGQVKATDKDGNAIKYNFIGGDVGFFRVDGVTGEIFTTVEISAREEYVVKVVAVDDGLPTPKTSTLVVKVKARPPNNYSPYFGKPIYDAIVVEKDASGKTIVQVTAKDDDLLYNNITYSILEGNPAAVFTINNLTGELMVNSEKAQMLDYDTQNIYPLAVQAKDAHVKPRSAITMVIVVLEDSNDHPPIFTRTEYETSIKENLKRGKCFFKAQATSGDSVDRIQYSIVNSTGPFVIHSSSGQICTEDSLDHEKIDHYDLTVQAFDGKFGTMAKIKVKVLDENDNTPQFEKDVFSVVVPNTARAGTVLLRLHVFDPDEGSNGQVTFWATNMYGLYDVNSTTGEVVLINDLNANDTDTLIYETEIFAQDHGTDPRSSKAKLIVKVSADGGHPPVFDKFVYEVVIAERMAPLEVVRATAHSPRRTDSKSIRYEIAKVIGINVHDSFEIDEIKGIVMLTKPLNYDENRFIQVSIEARDIEKQTLATEAIVQIKVADVNTHSPQFYPFPKSVRIPMSTRIGDAIYRLQAVDEDLIMNMDASNFTFDMMQSESMFRIDPYNGILLVEKRLQPTVQNITVVVRDKGFPPLETRGQLLVEVFDDNSQRLNRYPQFEPPQSYEKEYSGAIPIGTQLLQVHATSAAEEPVFYNISSSTCGDTFDLHHKQGKLFASRQVSNPICHIVINAYTAETPQFATETVVTIKSRNFQKSCPKFPLKEYRAAIFENTPVGEVVINDIQVAKPEWYQQLTYQIVTDNSAGHLYLESSKNVATLKIKKRVDREKMPSEYGGLFLLKVVAVYGNCSDWTTLKVRIDDINDNTPVFAENVYEVRVKENSPVKTLVGTIRAVDFDDVDKDKLEYAITEGNSDGFFKIDESTGAITVGEPPDRESTPSFDLVVTATDSANNTGMAKVRVIIEDVNDQTPKFLNDTIVLVLDEGPKSMNASFVLEAIDADDGINRDLQFRIIKGNDDAQFRLGSRQNKGVLRIIKELDRESFAAGGAAVKELQIEVKDKGEPPLSSTTTVFLLIDDINDMPPEFTEKIYKEVVYETSPIDMVITRVSAVDKDTVEITDLSYSFDEQSTPNDIPFAVNNETGVVTVVKQLDFAEQNIYNITLLVTDGKFLSKGLLQIHVKEELEPQGRSAVHSTRYQFRVPENVAGTKVGHIEQKISKWKVNRAKEFKILDIEANDAFNIQNDGTIYTKGGLDREKREVYKFVVLQEDKKRPEHKETYQVQIVVEDVNDEAPKFSRAYQGTISENSRPGTKVKIEPRVEASDADSGVNSVVVYFLKGVDSVLFSIDEVHGDVFWTGHNGSQLDRETKDEYVLQVGAMDLDNLTSSTNLTVTVTDINDNPPKFIHGDRTIEIPETMATGKKIARVTAVDLDAPGKNSEVIYSIVSDSEAFTANPLTGEVLLVKALKPETGHRINISAIDGGGLASSTVLNVRVLDVNNHSPQFVKNFHKFSISEGRYSTSPISLGVIAAKDKDFGQNAEITYRLIAPSESDAGLPFVIDSRSGTLNITGDLDRETQATFRFLILAKDGGIPSLNETTEVTVEVLDVNDEAPRFVGSPYHAQVAENKDPGQWVLQVRAVDFDSNSTGNGQVSYKLGGGHQNKFYIDSKDGNVWTLAALDYETQDSYNITVLAVDTGEPSLNSSAMLYVHVTDAVDIVPDFAKSVFTLEVAENTSPGSIIYHLESGSDAFTYTVNDDDGDATFSVDNRTGEVTLLRHLDAEKRSHYKMIVVAKDKSVPPNVDKALINIMVGTGQGLRMFPKRHYEVTVIENQAAPAAVFDFNATDETINKMVNYNILGNDYGGLFSIDHSTGKLMVKKSLDREVADKYQLRVLAEKAGKERRRRQPTIGDFDPSFVPSNEVLLTVNVGDENDNSPVFPNKGRPFVTAAPAEAGFGYEILRVRANDADDGKYGEIRYEIVQRDGDDSRKFFVDPVSGIIRSVIPLILDGSRVFGFDVKATDMEGTKTGKSAFANIIVHVLPDTKMVVMVLRTDPLTVESSLTRIAYHLSNLTGYDIRVCKMSAHTDEAVIDQNTTDMYLYAIDLINNSIVEVDILLSIFKDNMELIQEMLKGLNVLKVHAVTFKQKTESLSVSEVALLAFGCIIFISAVLGFISVCRHQRRRNTINSMTSGSFWEEHHKLYGMKSPLVSRTPGSSFADASIDTQRNSCNCIIHSRPGSGDGESQSYKDSLSSTSTLDLEKSRRPRQRAPSGGHSLVPPPPERGSPPMTKSRLDNVSMRRSSDSNWSRNPDDIDDDDDLDNIRDRFDHTQ